MSDGKGARPEAAGQREEKPWDSGEHMAPDPAWPVERQLRWYQVASHVLLLNCSELVRRRAAAEADREAPQGQPAPPAVTLTAPDVVAGLLADVAEGQATISDYRDALCAMQAERDAAQGRERMATMALAEELAEVRAELATSRELHRLSRLSAAGDESELRHIHETLAIAYGREDLSEETATVVEAMAAERGRYRAALAEIRDGDSKYGDHARVVAREALDGADQEDGEYPPVPVPAAAWVTLDDLADAISRCMPRIRPDIERADGWIAARIADPRDFAWSLLQQCAGWDPDAEMPGAAREARP